MGSFEKFLQEDTAIEELVDYLKLVEDVGYPETDNIKRIRKIVINHQNKI